MKKMLLLCCCFAVLITAPKTQFTLFSGTETTISKYDPVAGNLAAVHTFENPDFLFNSRTNLIVARNGLLYGTTQYGGGNRKGVIFSLDPTTNLYTKLYEFEGANGSFPTGGLVQAANGKLYGTTAEGGASTYYGVIFSFDPANNAYTKLFDFDGTNGWLFSGGGLIQGSNGKLYGMTPAGGIHDKGVIYSFDPATNTFTKLYDFDGTNGNNPTGRLFQAANGKLYGTTPGGGLYNQGVIFSFDPVTHMYGTVFNFDGINGGGPVSGLVQAADGKLYGGNTFGGNAYGYLFSFHPGTNTYNKLYHFDGTNGGYPESSLMLGTDGKLYGVAGSENFDRGVLFSFDPATGAYTKLGDFTGPAGRSPKTTPVEVVSACINQSGPIGVPAGLTVRDVTNTTATVLWNSTPGAGVYTLQYRLSGTGTWTTIQGIMATAYHLTELASGRQYEFRVAGACYSRSGAYSTIATFTPTGSLCNIPTGLVAADITASSALLRWTAISGAVNYTLRWKPVTASTWQMVNGIPSNSYVLGGLEGGTAYHMQLLAQCTGGSSSYGALVVFSTPCTPPANLRVTSTTHVSAALSWMPVPGADHYTVQYQEAAVTDWKTVSGLATNSFLLAGLTEGAPYNVRLAAVCSNTSTSSYSAVTRFATACSSLPTGLVVTNSTSTSASLKWNASPGAVSYNLQWKTASATTWNTISGIAGTSRNISGLTAGSTYQFRVQKVCREGSTAYSGPVNFTATGAVTRADALRHPAVVIGKGIALSVAPNPVRGRSVIRYQVLAAGRLTLKVVDLNGRLLQSMELGHRQAGAYTHELGNSGRLAAGFYILLLEQDGRTIACRQLMLDRQ